MLSDQTKSRRPGYRAAGLAAGIAAVTLLGGCMSTTTYGTGEAPELAVFREIGGGIFGGVLGRGKKDPIRYNQRAPIVAPPEASLPVPAQSVAAVNPQWPDDPDKRQRAKLSDEVTPDYYERVSPLARLVKKNPGPNCAPIDKDCDGDISPQEALAFRDGRAKFAAAVNDAEGVQIDERKYLTDPPKAFSVPAGTAPTEFEDIKRKKEGGFLGGWILRAFN